MTPSKNKDIPHPGRRWYDGQWRTPKQVARRQEQHKAKMRKRRESREYVDQENAQARERMRRIRRSAPVRAIVRWKPKREDLLAAAECSDELMELVLASLREDTIRFGAGYARGLGRTFSLDAPTFTDGHPGTWHDVHGDPNHFREPGYADSRMEA